MICRNISKRISYCAIICAVLAIFINLSPIHDTVYAEEPDPQCWVLVIGVSEYPIRDFNVTVIDEDGENITDIDLKYPNDDANQIYESFCSAWGEDNSILLLNENATKTDIYYAIKQLKEKVSPADKVLIYFSGHGMAPVDDGMLPGRLYAQRAGAGYLSPYGTRITHLNYEISAIEFASWLKGLEANQTIIMLDTCYAGSFKRELSQKGRVILMSSGPDEPSYECPEIGHGVFTNFVLQAIDNFDDADINNDFELSAEEIYNFAEPLTIDGIATCDEEPVTEKMKQHPVLSDGYAGELSLFMKVTIHCETPSTSDTVVYNIDDNTYTSRSDPAFLWIPESAHTIKLPAVIEGNEGERLVFASWSDENTSASRTITEGGDYTVTYKRQYEITLNSPYGSPAGGGWHDNGTIATISITSPEGMLIRQRFNGWYGSIVNNAMETTVLIDGAKNIEAEWIPDYIRLYILALFLLILSCSTAVLIVIRKKKRRAESATFK